MSIWDAYSRVYDHLWVQKVSLGPTRRMVLKVLCVHNCFDGPLLDMSCGTGQLMSEVLAYYPRADITGVEPSALGQVAQRKGLTVIPQSIETLNLNRTYQTILCTHAFPYYKDPNLALDQLAYHLRPGGLLIIAHAHTNSIYDKCMLFLVKLTTTKAHYPKSEQMMQYLSSRFDVISEHKVNAKGIPSIVLYVAQKR